MRIIFFLLTLVTLSASPSAPTDSYSAKSVIDGHFPQMVDGLICPLTGAVTLNELDGEMMSLCPITLERTYSSHRATFAEKPVGWKENCKNRMVLDVLENFEGRGQTRFGATFQGSFGQNIYLLNDPKPDGRESLNEFLHDKIVFKMGQTNLNGPEISGRSHPKNCRMIRLPGALSTDFVFKTGSGMEVEFIGWDDTFTDRPAARIIYPNSHYQKFKYSEGQGIQEVMTFTRHHKLLSKVNFTLSKRFERADFLNGVSIAYHYDKHFNIIKVVPSDGIEQDYTYDKHNRLIKNSRPDGREIHFTYRKNDIGLPAYSSDSAWKHTGRAESVSVPSAPDGSLVEVIRLFYERHDAEDWNRTTVLDPWNVRRIWRINQGATKHISYLRPDIGDVYSRQEFYWADPEGPDAGCLMAMALKQGEHNILLAKHYTYDARGNPLEEKLYGNLTGKETETLQLGERGEVLTPDVEHHTLKKTFTDRMNLIATEDDGLKVRELFYYQDTDLIHKELIRVDGAIKERHYYVYDENLALLEEWVDDGLSDDPMDLSGITERSVIRKYYANPLLGLPNEEETLFLNPNTGTLLPVSRVKKQYDSRGRVIEQSVYNGQGDYILTRNWEYDNRGNVIRETGPLGSEVIRRFDANNNLIYEAGPLFDHEKHFTYDKMDRLIEEREIHGTEILLTRHAYDVMGRKTETENCYGLTTRFEHDFLGRVTAIHEGADRIVKKGYAPTGHLTSLIDPKNGVTEYLRTVRGDPYYARYPDGTEERWEYDLNGRMIRHQTTSGIFIECEYDYKGRLITQIEKDREGNFAQAKSWHYNAFHLLSEVDEMGVETHYEYNFLGQLIRKTHNGLEVRFYYTPNGHLETQITDNSLIERFYYDEIGRLIAETKEDASGQLLYTESRTYDLAGRKLFETKGDYTTLFAYNSKGELIEKTAPDGRKTYYTYDHAFRNPKGETVLLRRMIDPAGTVTEWEHDLYGQEVRTATFDPYGTLLKQTFKVYNVMGQVGKIIEEIFYQGQKERLYETHFRYDPLGRPTQVTEEKGTTHEKNTYTSYDAYGQKVKVVKPNGITLTYDYDLRGRLIHEKSCNRTVEYAIAYTAASRPETVTDCVHHIASHYTYDPDGRLTHEIQAHGEWTQNRYDTRGRLTQVTHSRSSPITLTYDALFLRAVSWNDLNATYNAYDLSGNLIHGADTTYTYDTAGRLTGWSRGPYSESLTYNAAGNLSSRILLGEKTDYDYDALYQLEKEAGSATKTYAHDSHYNRRQKDGTDYTLDPLNCPTAYGSATYTWDRNGNLLSRNENGRLTEYTYDARDRLIALKTDDGKIIPYLWDEQNRCLMAGTTRFLYQGRAEIGSVDNDTLSTFRVLGLGRGQEVGATLWAQVQDEILTPLHDLSGNLFALTTLSGHLAAHRPLSAFGEPSETGFGTIPWGFCSKRREAHSGLILFGYRFYDSTLGRFTTADPAGFDAGPNLWAYCNNNPLTNGDLFGLSTHPFLEDASSEPTCDTIDFDTDPDNSLEVETSTSPSIETCCLGHFVASAVRSTCYWTGHGIETIAFHAIPHLPGVKDIPMLLGHVLKGGCYCTYTPTKRHNLSRWVSGGTRPFNPKQTAILCCGMSTSVEEGQKRANGISKDIHGYLAFVFVPGDHGLVSNLLSCLVEYMGFNLYADKLYKQGIEQINAKMDKDGTMHTLCFSRGNLISLNASRSLQAEGSDIHKSIDYTGVASPNLPKKNDYGTTELHSSSRDGVSFLMGIGRWNPPDYLYIHESNTLPFIDHMFDGEVYYKIYYDVFIEKYNSRKNSN